MSLRLRFLLWLLGLRELLHAEQTERRDIPTILN